MGQTASSSVRSLPSYDTPHDAEILQLIFGGSDKLQIKETVSYTKDSCTTVLVHAEERLVFFLVVSTQEDDENDTKSRDNDATSTRAKTRYIPITWVVDPTFLESNIWTLLPENARNSSSVLDGIVLERDSIDGTEVALIHLSATTLILFPPALVEQPTGRLALAQRLSGPARRGTKKLTTSTSFAEKTKEAELEATTATSTAASTASTTSSARTSNQNQPSNETVNNTDELSNNQNDVSDKERAISSGTLVDTKEYTPPSFPTLDVNLLQKGGSYDQRLFLNTQYAQEVDTDLFKGKILLLVKPTKPEDDPYWTEQVFGKKKRSFILQLQGKFKRVPKDQLYVGGEITEPIRVGLLTRGVMGMLLRFLESFVSNVVYTFGDKDGKENARVVIPAHWAFNRVHRTPVGEEPPPMTAEPFEEPEKERKRRAKVKVYDWNTEETFSMTFFSMYFNFVDWSMVNLPITGDLDLTNFWGDAALRIVMYENGSNKKHLQKQNSYFFSMQMKHSEKEENDQDSIGTAIAVSDRTSRLLDEQPSFESAQSMPRSESMLFPDLPTESDIPDDDKEKFYDPLDTFSDGSESLVEGLYSAKDKKAITLAVIDVNTPAWVEMPNSKGSYSTFYAINVGNKTILRSKSDCDQYMEKCGLRAKAVAFVHNAFSKQLSSSERRRRMLGFVISNCTSLTEKDIPPGDSVPDSIFLQQRSTGSSDEKDSNVVLSGLVARAVSDRHWVEEWATVCTDGKVTFRRLDKKRPSLHLSIPSMLALDDLGSEKCPSFLGHSFLSIETLGRSIYMMFQSSFQRDNWHTTLTKFVKRAQSSNKPQESNIGLLHVDSPVQEFMHDSSLWDCKKRRVYNCATFSLRAQGSLGHQPLALIQKALKLSIDSMKNESVSRRHEFFKSVAVLKSIDLDGLKEEEKTAFFLNLYHTMVMHAFLIWGPPSGSLRFVSLFKEVAYEIGDDILSLAELEHGVIRSEMAHPANILSRFVIPKTKFRFALKTTDFRFNFALNSGSKSGPDKVILYSAEGLDEQLNAATRLYLRTATVSRQGPRDVTITLPRVCQWFGQDFGKSEVLLAKIAPHLPLEERDKLAECWSPEKNAYDMSCIAVRYSDFSFSCRPLTLE